MTDQTGPKSILDNMREVYPDQTKNLTPEQLEEMNRDWSDEKWNEMLEERARIIPRWVGDAKGEKETPLALVVETDHSHRILSFLELPDDAGTAMLLLEATGFKVYSQLPEEPSAAWWITPAWMKDVDQKKPGALEEALRTRPADSPDRIDAVVLTGMAVDGRTAMSWVKVERDEEGNLTGEASEPELFPYKRGESQTVDNILGSFWSGIQTAKLAKVLKMDPDEKYPLKRGIPRDFCEKAVARVSKAAYDFGMEIVDMNEVLNAE